MMEKGIITFKHTSKRFLDSLRNCWQPTAVQSVHKSDAIVRLSNTSLRLYRGRET